MATEDNIYFQTLILTIRHPESGEEVERIFAGKAILSPDEIRRFGNTPVESIIAGFEISAPFNPYEDNEGHEKAHEHVVRSLRETLRQLEGKDGESKDPE